MPKVQEHTPNAERLIDLRNSIRQKRKDRKRAQVIAGAVGFGWQARDKPRATTSKQDRGDEYVDLGHI